MQKYHDFSDKLPSLNLRLAVLQLSRNFYILFNHTFDFDI